MPHHHHHHHHHDHDHDHHHHHLDKAATNTPETASISTKTHHEQKSPKGVGSSSSSPPSNEEKKIKLSAVTANPNQSSAPISSNSGGGGGGGGGDGGGGGCDGGKDGDHGEDGCEEEAKEEKEVKEKEEKEKEEAVSSEAKWCTTSAPTRVGRQQERTGRRSHGTTTAESRTNADDDKLLSCKALSTLSEECGSSTRRKTNTSITSVSPCRSPKQDRGRCRSRSSNRSHSPIRMGTCYESTASFAVLAFHQKQDSNMSMCAPNGNVLFTIASRQSLAATNNRQLQSKSRVLATRHDPLDVVFDDL